MAYKNAIDTLDKSVNGLYYYSVINSTTTNPIEFTSHIYDYKGDTVFSKTKSNLENEHKLMLALDKDGNLYHTGEPHKLYKSGTEIFDAGSGINVIAFDKDGNRYIGTTNGKVYKNEVVLYQNDTDGAVMNIAIDKNLNVYYRMLKVGHGDKIFKNGVIYKDNIEFQLNAHTLAVDFDGNVYYSDNHNIYKNDAVAINVTTNNFIQSIDIDKYGDLIFSVLSGSPVFPNPEPSTKIYKNVFSDANKIFEDQYYVTGLSTSKIGHIYYSNVHGQLFKNGTDLTTLGQTVNIHEIATNNFGGKTGMWEILGYEIEGLNWDNVSKSDIPSSGAQANTITLNDLSNVPSIPSGITINSLTHPEITGAGTTKSVTFTLSASDSKDTFSFPFPVSVTIDKSLQQKIDELNWGQVSLINNNLPSGGVPANSLNQISLFNGIPTLPSGATIVSIEHPEITKNDSNVLFSFNISSQSENYSKKVIIPVAVAKSLKDKVDSLDWVNLSSNLSEYGVDANSLQEYQIIGMPAYSSVDSNIVLDRIINPSVKSSGNYNVSLVFVSGNDVYSKQVIVNFTLNIILNKDDENKYVQNYSPNADISSYDLSDYIPESLIKVYPYRAIYGKAGEYILNTGQTTFVRISQNGVDDFIHLKLDENGYKYVDVFSIIDNQTKVSIANTPSKITQTIRKVKSFTAITNDYFDTYDDKPDFFTIGEPYNYDKYIKGKQNIYYAQNFTPTLPQVVQELYDQDFDLNEDTSRISELSLKDITELEAQFSKSKLVFLDFSPILNNIENIKIKVLPNVMLDSIKLKGYNNLEDTNVAEKIDLDYYATSDNLAWFQAVPIATKNKLSITTPWFDENIVLDKKVADYILSQGSVKLSQLLKFFNISETIKDKITDMFLFSQQFNEQFGKVPRTSNGAIEPKWAIGNQRLFVESIASSNPISINDGLYKQWRKENPDLVGGDSDKFFKAFINAISSEVTTNLATGKGENDFNKAILPWTITLAEKIVAKQTETTANKPEEGGYIELEGNDIKIKLILNSKYFTPISDIVQTNPEDDYLVPVQNIDMSEINFVEAERRITLPELPENLTEINKLSNPGDVSTTTDNDLKYFLKLPLSVDENEKLYKGATDWKPGLKTITLEANKTSLYEKYGAWNFDLETTNGHSVTSNPAKQEILKQIKDIYTDATNINWISNGRDVTVDKQSNIVVGALGTGSSGWWIFKNPTVEQSSQIYSIDKDFDDWFKNGNLYEGYASGIDNGSTTKDVVIWRRSQGLIFVFDSGTTRAQNENEAKNVWQQFLASYYKVDVNDVVIKTFNLLGKEYNSGGGFYWRGIEYSFYIKRHNWEGYSLSFDTKLPSRELVHLQTIYDRPKWKQLIKSIVDPNNGLLRTINLKHKYEIGNYEISDIIISTIFGDFIYLDFGDGRLMRIDLYQKDDESSTTQVIKFF